MPDQLLDKDYLDAAKKEALFRDKPGLNQPKYNVNSLRNLTHHEGEVKGRRKGQKNKIKKMDKEIIASILQDNADRLRDQMARMRGYNFVRCYINLLEFVMPKLQRVDVNAAINNRNFLVILPQKDALDALDKAEGEIEAQYLPERGITDSLVDIAGIPDSLGESVFGVTPGGEVDLSAVSAAPEEDQEDQEDQNDD